MSGAIKVFGLALVLLFALSGRVLSWGTLEGVQSIPSVSSVDCSTDPKRRGTPIDRWSGLDPAFSYSYKFSPDGRSNYTFTGRCQASSSDGSRNSIRYYVDASWDPKQQVAFEVGRVYDLGNIAPDKFQPGPNSYTSFVLRERCPGDPWLYTKYGCYVESAATNHLDELVPHIKNGPFPLTADALIPVVREKLRSEYEQIVSSHKFSAQVQQRVPVGQFVFPGIASPTSGQRFFSQAVVPIKLTPPQGWKVAGYMVAIQKKDASGNWVNYVNIPIPAAQAESIGFTGFGAGGTAATKQPSLFTSPGSWRLAAQALSPSQSGWSQPVEFVVSAPFAPSSSTVYRKMVK